MVKYIKYKNKKLPIRVSYRALSGFQRETGIAFDEMQEKGGDLSHFEILLYHALLSGAKADEVEFQYEREDVEDILDECFTEFTGLIPEFFPNPQETGNPDPNRQERRKADRKKA